MTKKERTEQSRQIREQYRCYKVGDLAARLVLHGVSEQDCAYILQGGAEIELRPYARLQAWLAGAMDRMAERLPAETADAIRQDGACCLGGVRDQIARGIRKNNATVDARFEALSKDRRIIGGNAWKADGDYFITYWYAKPATGYTCGCLHHVPSEPMNLLWCACCAGHIRHHFETALGVRATCVCVDSVLHSCGENACLFRLHVTELLPDKT